MSRDPQRFKAYRWEASFMGWLARDASHKILKSYVDHALELYGVPPVKVKFVTKDKRSGKTLDSYYDPNTHMITLRPRHQEISSALHEAAHAIADYVLGFWNIQPHGKEWLGIFMHLLSKYKIAPRAALEAHARKRGLKFDNTLKAQPRSIRASHKMLVRAAGASRSYIKLAALKHRRR